MGKWLNVTQGEFNSIKAMLDNGLSQYKVKKLTGRSSSTIWIIAQTEDLDAYHKFTKKQRTNYNDRRVVVRKGQLEVVPVDKPVKRPYMKSEEHAKIKTLEGAGLTTKQIALVTGRSTITVNRIKLSKTYEDYKAQVAEYNAKHKVKATLVAIPVAHESKEESVPVKQYGIAGANDALVVKAIEANTQALVALALAFNGLEDKIGEVLELKRPWLNNVRISAGH